MDFLILENIGLGISFRNNFFHFNTNKLLQAFPWHICYWDYSAAFIRILKGQMSNQFFSICDLWPLTTNWVMVNMKNIYFQNPTSIPDYHASFQSYSAIYLLPVFWFMCQGRAHFHEHFLTVFLGWLPKNDHEIGNNWIRLLYHTSF